MNGYLFSRVQIVFFLAFFLCLVILIRVTDIQVIRGSQLALQSENNRLYTLETPQHRGVFLDRFRQSLVSNSTVAYQRTSPDALYSPEVPIPHSEMLLLEATQSGALSRKLFRYYPYAEALSHLVGYTSQATREDLEKDTELSIFDQVGRTGLEAFYELELRGTGGSEVYEINALGKKTRIVERQLPQSGAVLETSIDSVLSQVAYQAMGDKTGAVVILDADTADVLTLISTPAFDTNAMSMFYVDESEEQARKELVFQYLSDEDQVFFNRAVSGMYPPGSVFKLITALAGLEAGKIDRQTSVLDEGVLTVGEYSYANWYFSQFGRVEGDIGLRRALARSNDIFFYKAAEWVGPTLLATMAQNFGYGDKTGLDLRGEAAGVVPTPEWKEQVIGERWFLGNTYHMGIGQGDLLVTPLQVASMTQAVANQAVRCTPSIVAQQPECSSVSLSDQHVALVLEGMVDACSTGGTAFPFFEVNAPFESLRSISIAEKLDKGAVACKTGTAEFGGANEKGIRKTHGWFIAIFDTELATKQEDAQAVSNGAGSVASDSARLQSQRERWLSLVNQDNYPRRLVVAVLVESDESEPYREGSSDAAPVAREIFDWVRGG